MSADAREVLSKSVLKLQYPDVPVQPRLAWVGEILGGQAELLTLLSAFAQPTSRMRPGVGLSPSDHDWNRVL